MRRVSLSLILSSALLFGTLLTLNSPAFAQATRTWVSGVGDDANPCSRIAPCKTFAGAISKTTPGGEINCLDSGGFGALTITKAISVACESVEAGVLVAGTNGITVAAGASDVVVLRGLDIEGLGSGLDGIKFNSGAALHVENCVIRGFLGAPGNGIHFAPTGASQLFVHNTIITDNNKGAASAGILVQPTGTGTAKGTIDAVQLLNGGNGFILDGSQTTGSQMDIVLSNSTVSGAPLIGVKVNAAAGKAASRAIVSQTAIVTNNIGISSAGTGADVTLAYSVVSGNNTGLAFTAPAEIRSYQTNQLRGNLVANGAPSSTLPLE
jgi:hypothetical protein